MCTVYRVLIMSKGVRVGARERIESTGKAHTWVAEFGFLSLSASASASLHLSVCLSTGVIYDNDRVLDNLLDRSTILGLVNPVLGHGSPSFLFLFLFLFLFFFPFVCVANRASRRAVWLI